MHLDQELKNQSRTLLEKLGEALDQLFDPSQLPHDPVMEDLLRQLDDIPFCRETDMDRANQRVCRMLERRDGGLQRRIGLGIQ